MFKGVTALLNGMLVHDRVSDVKDASVEDSHLSSSLSILTSGYDVVNKLRRQSTQHDDTAPQCHNLRNSIPAPR